ncbi:zinc ABC transporter ATP-binding protein ZnuC [Ketobacter alkanivorans]|uniref:Zinc ABC transporter ATP-binding protein ZnuC n=1 Tax=Ketobacter alkanivorans TaxID=1917421 RepID=A0A2K9LL08_9GAMM|nr:zinc ABC transporter ATP-binding protein ZnuC [Ketobacter alkanivorans]AUM12943.1 zinc ABC transporter ATP-binding protein ZnuC [Ketobacter alkanivorans]MCP5016021.1 zinc ABC transporter ATP-binding protein ZnuC [Ketobacter sp.]
MTQEFLSQDTLVALHDVGLDFKSRRVLDHISFNVNRREILTIIGPNGAGKSCLLKVILGLYRPTRGTCQRASGLKIGYMPQKLTVDGSLPLSVERFLTLANKGDNQPVDAVLRRVGARSLRYAAVQSLSGGEFQRVLLARALLREPDLLVLDEPAQGVDLQGQQALYHLLAQLRDEQGFAILMVSHDLHFVMAQTDQVLCLNQHVCCSGTAESVSKHPEYLNLFANDAVEDIAIYTHNHDHHHDLHGHVVEEHNHTEGGCKHD